MKNFLKKSDRKRLRFEEMLQSHIEETGGYKQAREKLIDELTFTPVQPLGRRQSDGSGNIVPAGIDQTAGTTETVLLATRRGWK